MPEDQFCALLIEAAEETNRKLRPERIAQLKKSYAFFKESGLSDEQLQTVMALTSHEMRLIRNGHPD